MASEAKPLFESGAKAGKHTPPDVRVGFITKVYGIVISMLFITGLITYPFVFYEHAALQWCKDHMWVVALAVIFLLAQHILHMCMMAEQCMGGSSIAEGYFRMLATVPVNYIYLLAYSLAMGLLVGVICSAYKASSVCMVFWLTLLIIVGLTVYAVYTKCDFTGMGSYILVAMLALLGFSFIGMFFPAGSLFHRVIAAVGAMIFGFIIIYDTQLIFGEASAGGEKSHQYSLDMYAFAALELYMDFINFFIYMLQLLGERD